MNCNFEEGEFICGYERTFQSGYRVYRKKVNLRNEQNEPQDDGQPSQIGHYMFADPKYGSSGSRTYLTSPSFNTTQNSLLLFSYYVTIGSGDDTSEILFTLLSRQGVDEVSYRLDHNVWIIYPNMQFILICDLDLLEKKTLYNKRQTLPTPKKKQFSH